MSAQVAAVAFGEVLWDVINGKEFLGGAPLNFAAHFSKCGGRSGIVSCVGKDDLGARALRDMATLGVDTRFVAEDPAHATGTVDVYLRNGQPDYDIKEDVAYDFIPGVAAARLKASRFDVLYFGTLAQRSPVSGNSLKEILSYDLFDHHFYDINLRKNLQDEKVIRHSLENCTILKINADELKSVSAMFYRKTLSAQDFSVRIRSDFGLDVIVITTGPEGCFVYAEEIFEQLPGVPVKVVDTVGAGDAFSAAFMYTYLVMKDPFEAARIANCVGSFVAGSGGPIPDYSPAIKQTLALLKSA